MKIVVTVTGQDIVYACLRLSDIYQSSVQQEFCPLRYGVLTGATRVDNGLSHLLLLYWFAWCVLDA